MHFTDEETETEVSSTVPMGPQLARKPKSQLTPTHISYSWLLEASNKPGKITSGKNY